MRFSNDGTDYGAWQAYSVASQWSLLDGKGSKTIYVEFRDYAGLISTSSDSIMLTSGPAVGRGFPIEYFAVSIVAASIAIAVGIYVLRRRPKLKSREKKHMAPPPFFPNLRWIQGQVFEVLSKGKQVRCTNAFHANVLHNLVVRIGPADQDWLTPEEGPAFPEHKEIDTEDKGKEPRRFPL